MFAVVLSRVLSVMIANGFFWRARAIWSFKILDTTSVNKAVLGVQKTELQAELLTAAVPMSVKQS